MSIADVFNVSINGKTYLNVDNPSTVMRAYGVTWSVANQDAYWDNLAYLRVGHKQSLTLDGLTFDVCGICDTTS